MRGKLLVGFVGIVIIIIAVFAWMRLRQPHPATPTASSGAAKRGDFERQLYLDIAREGLTPERAKQLFSLVVAPLPDVTVPADGADPDEFCATSAITAVFAVWQSLTDAQRAVVNKFVSTQGRIGHNDTTPPLPVPSGQPRVILASLQESKPVDKPKFDYKQFAIGANGVIAGHLNQPAMVFDLDVYDYDYNDKHEINKLTKAATYSWDGNDQPQPDGCHIRVFDSVFIDNSYTEIDAQSIITHEMFHCYQQRSIGNQPDYRKLKRWIGEGEADWVMATLVPAASAYLKDSNEYSMTPTRQFDQRGQDGLGVFGHLADVSGSDGLVWTRMLPMIKTALASGDLDAFQYLIGGQVFDYYTTWGPSYFLVGAKPNWGMTSPGQPPTQQNPPVEITVNEGDEKIFPDVGSYESETVKLSSNADILAVGVFTGYGRLHDEKFGLDTVLVADTTVAMCLKAGGCTCPDGSAGASLLTKPAKAPIYIGLAGADGIALSGAMAEKLDQFCKKPKHPPVRPKPPGGRGGDGGGGGDEPDARRPDNGSSMGDTHIATLDGVRYDFQVVGEYTLVRSTKDDFVVQVRQVPAKQSRTVTVNQAMATKIGGSRVNIAVENGTMVLRVDGTPAADPRIRFSSGDTISQSSTMSGVAFLLEWSDGTTVRVDQLGARALNVTVKPDEARKGTLVGLLGNDNASPEDDLTGLKGAALGTHPDADVITHALADAWRITQSASLFDYQPGQSTATFTDRTFPDQHVDPSKVPDRETAEKICREAGITDSHLLDDCIIDYGLTSDFLFADSYSHQQQILALHAITATATTGVLRTVMFEGNIADAKSHASVPFTARAGDVIWIGNPDCTDNYMQGVIVTPDNKRIGGGALCTLGRIVLPLTGDYTLQTRETNNPTGAFHVPIHFVRPDRVQPASYGSVVAGQIETQGVHDVYPFEGHAGDVLRFSGEGCDLGILVVSVIDPEGHDSLGPFCREGSDARLRATGKFQLVINGADSGKGAYHFVFQGASTAAK